MIQRLLIRYLLADYFTAFRTCNYLQRLFILSLIIFFQILFTSKLSATPYIPENDAIVLQKLPASSASMQALSQLRSQLSQAPADLSLAVELARGYLQMGRTMADPRYEGYAQAALKPWWDLARPPPEVLVLRAVLQQRRHDFAGALSDLAQALQMQPENEQAWLTQAAIHQVRGDYQAAYQSCLPILRLSSHLLSTACIASVSSLNGRAHESLQILQKAIDQASAATPQEKLWALTILAETAERIEKYAEAEQYFKAALAVNRQDSYLLGAYSDFLLDQKRPEDVQNILQQSGQSDGLLLRLALAAQQLKAPERDTYIRTLKARFAANRLRGEASHLREEARFTLHLLREPEQALKLAIDNWHIQREPWDARILLEAALQHNDRTAAQPVIDWLRSVNLEDGQLDQLVEQLS